MKYKKKILFIILIAILCIFLDQFTKFLIVNNMDLADTIQIIRNFFRISYVHNTGAAWSIFSGNRFFLITISLFVVGIFIYFLMKTDHFKQNDIIIYGVLIGGILGNLIDRIRYGYVIDFLDFNFGSIDFPIFNVADMCIVIAGFFLIVKILKEDEK